MLAAKACLALRESKCVKLRYGGFERVVEVHVVGRSGVGRDMMRVWQVRGGSASGARTGWKMLHLEAVRFSHMTEEDAHAPRPGYRSDDPVMSGGHRMPSLSATPYAPPTRPKGGRNVASKAHILGRRYEKACSDGRSTILHVFVISRRYPQSCSMDTAFRS